MFIVICRNKSNKSELLNIIKNYKSEHLVSREKLQFKNKS